MKKFHIYFAALFCAALPTTSAIAIQAQDSDVESAIEQLKSFNKTEQLWSKGILIDDEIVPFAGDRQQLRGKHIKEHGQLAGGPGECCECHW